jgi:parallel beta-helix repeat protein
MENFKNLPDKLTVADGYPASTNKSLLDKAGKDIKTYLNDVLTPELDSKFADIDNNNNSVVSQLAEKTKQLQNFVSVEQFGAVGDGVTDDTTAIQDAINSNVAKIVFDGTKTYIAKDIKIPSNKIIDGNGATIKLLDNANTAIFTNSNYNDGENSNIEICNLHLDGNYSNQSNYNSTTESDWFFLNCIYLKGVNRVKIHNLIAEKSAGICIYTNNCKDIEIFGCSTKYSNRHSGITCAYSSYYGFTKIYNNLCNYNNLDGIEAPSNSEVYSNNCSNNGVCAYTGDLPAAGIYLGANISNVKIYGNECNYNSGMGIEVNTGSNNNIFGNICKYNRQHGIILNETMRSQVNNNICVNNGQDTAGTYNGIWFGSFIAGSTARYITAIGNICYDDQATKTQSYGLCSVNTDYNTIIGNRLEGNKTDTMLKNQNASSYIMNGLSDYASKSLEMQTLSLFDTLSLLNGKAFYLPKSGYDVAGCIKFDNTTKHFMGFDGTTWKQLDN